MRHHAHPAVSPIPFAPESPVFRRIALLLCGLLSFATFAPFAHAADADPKVLVERGWYRRAVAVLEPRVAAQPKDAAALAMLALCRQQLGDLDGALKLAERAVAAAPNDAEAHWAVAAVCGERAQKASALAQLGLARRFKKEAEAAARLDPKHVPARRALIQFHFMAPGIVGGDKKKVDPLVAEIAAADPMEGWLAGAMAAGFRRDTVAAAQDYEKAVVAAPQRYEALLGLAQWLATPARGPVARVEKLANDAQSVAPQRIGSYSLLAAVYAYAQRWSDLDAVLARAEANVPDSRGAHYQAARQILADGHDPARAEKLLRAYLAVPPDGGPSHAAARWRLALALEHQGRKSEAVAELERALKLDPGLEPAKRDLKRLRG